MTGGVDEREVVGHMVGHVDAFLCSWKQQQRNINLNARGMQGKLSEIDEEGESSKLAASLKLCPISSKY